MIINGIKVKVEQKSKFNGCKGCIFYNPKLFKKRRTVCEAPNAVCHIDTIFVKDE